MTSQQLQAKLEAAIAIIAECEMVLAFPDKAARRGDDEVLKYSVFEFMDLHRDQKREGGVQ
jgi:hypothetical protein